MASIGSVLTGTLSVTKGYLESGHFNETEATAALNTGLINEAQDRIVDALPGKYEVPVRTVITGYGVVTGFMFKEASMNSSCPK